jgi:hypothetical protein
MLLYVEHKYDYMIVANRLVYILSLSDSSRMPGIPGWCMIRRRKEKNKEKPAIGNSKRRSSSMVADFFVEKTETDISKFQKIHK